jgi:2-hydroxychromene-2-carboxylate isomerase
VLELPLEIPAGHPFPTADALSCVLAVAPEAQMPLARAFFRAYWVEARDISKREVIARVLRAEGHDPEAVRARADSAAIRDALREATRLALERGVFGAPTFFVGDALFFGADRMHLVERALGGEPTSPFPEVPTTALRPVDGWFDYSSPYAYIGMTHARRILGPALRPRPMLLGALFKKIGQVMVPMLEFSEPKRRAMGQDLERQAAEAGVPFRFPSRFPMNTVAALRLTLAAGLEGAPGGHDLIDRIFSAYWSEDADISDPSTLGALVDEVGLDGRALLEKTRAPEVKAQLFAATDAAAEAGVFGAPTFAVSRPDGGQSLYWGSDRLFLAAQAAAGHTAVY